MKGLIRKLKSIWNLPQNVNYLKEQIDFLSSIPVHNEQTKSQKTLIPTKQSMESIRKQMKSMAPEAFEKWDNLEEQNETFYDGFPTHSCSVSGHRMATNFRTFCIKYLHGDVLDIGCGPQPIPSYLTGYPFDRIYGLDPLEGTHPFIFAQGYAEFLPWEDNSFDCVMIATSFDHVLLPDQVMREITRVLKPKGFFINWVSFMDAPAYNPYAKNITPVDAHHMFHFSKDWYEQLVGETFWRIEYTHIGDSSFYTWMAK